jgi:hypothetical protein
MTPLTRPSPKAGTVLLDVPIEVNGEVRAGDKVTK